MPRCAVFLALAALGLASAATSAFDRADQNHDGSVDRTEFAHLGDATKAALLTVFDPPSKAAVEKASVLKRFDLSKTGMLEMPGFMPAFINSVMMIWATEVGDKTFFIAAILSMRHPPFVVFTGALLALAIMTVLSAAMGFALPNLMPKKYTHYGAALLFLYFGVKLLREGMAMQHGRSEEFEEAEEELQDKKVDGPGGDDVEAGAGAGAGVAVAAHEKAMTAVFWQALSLTFLAEWGDRSQIATIALAAAKNPLGVIAGGCVGHAMCTGLAVVGGRMLAASISERTVALSGGVLFVLFALHGIYTVCVAPLAPCSRIQASEPAAPRP